MKQREVIFRAAHKGHDIEVVRVTAVLDAPGRKMKVERSLQAFINGVPLKYEQPDEPGLQRELVDLAHAVADQLPPRNASAAAPESAPNPDNQNSTSI